MYKGFNVNDFEGGDFSSYIEYGRTLHAKNKRVAKAGLESFKDENGRLNASAVVDEWFPDIEYDVFLSHSHKDEDAVIGFSGWLYEEFGLTSFIDSCIWGYSDELLKLIDVEHCWDKARDAYDYDERNRSTSHVHMMLSIALMKTIDRCESVFFLNTPNSILPRDYIKGKGVTASPWIYSEISMCSLIRKRPISAHRTFSLEALAESRSLEKSLQVDYDMDLSHLSLLSQADLFAWRKVCNKRGARALDSLYQLKGAFYG